MEDRERVREIERVFVGVRERVMESERVTGREIPCMREKNSVRETDTSKNIKKQKSFDTQN